jgi:hypothetical protein
MPKSATSVAAFVMVVPMQREGAYLFAVLLMEAEDRKWKGLSKAMTREFRPALRCGEGRAASRGDCKKRKSAVIAA